MSSTGLPSNGLGKTWSQADRLISDTVSKSDSAAVAAEITKAASRQTYYTIALLVDRPRVADAYRAYGYFRWVDDSLDRPGISKREQKAFLERQQWLVERCYRGSMAFGSNAQEQMHVDLIDTGRDYQSGLRAYIQNMMAVMTFDVNRRGRLISAAELDNYSLNLATAVTEALHYFIGHDTPAPQLPTRYLAATGAHVVHMLRDAEEDTALGYFNIPREYLDVHGIDPCEIGSEAHREWVRQRLELAKSCFRAGKVYLSQVSNARCRLAAFAYMARFSTVMRVIEQENYQLRPTYKETLGWPAMLRLGSSVLPLALRMSY